LNHLLSVPYDTSKSKAPKQCTLSLVYVDFGKPSSLFIESQNT